MSDSASPDNGTTVEPDVDVVMVAGNVRCVPLSERGLRWFFGTCPPEFRRYFCYRAYGDTPFGWFVERPGRRLERLITRMQADGLRVFFDGNEIPVDEAAT